MYKELYYIDIPIEVKNKINSFLVILDLKERKWKKRENKRGKPSKKLGKNFRKSWGKERIKTKSLNQNFKTVKIV